MIGLDAQKRIQIPRDRVRERTEEYPDDFPGKKLHVLGKINVGDLRVVNHLALERYFDNSLSV